MKNSVFILLLIFSLSVFGQKNSKKEKSEKSEKITPKKGIDKKGYFFQLKEVNSDSRCPEGLQCIWAGEVQCVVLIYKDKKIIEEAKLTILPNNNEEAILFFQKYYTKKKIRSIYVLPFPIKDKVLNKKEYHLEINFE